MKQTVMGWKEGLFNAERSWTVKKSGEVMKAPRLASKYIQKRDSHAGSNDPEDPKPYPQVVDVTQMIFVQLEQVMISLNFCFFKYRHCEGDDRPK